MERVVVLQRVHEDMFGTFGKASTPLGFSAYSIELPWRDNRRNISCIPKGEYECRYTWSPTFRRKLYLAMDVPNRSGIRLHVANLAGDVLCPPPGSLKSHLKGCIGFGLRIGVLAGQRAVLSSGPAMQAFERHMERDRFKLVIQ